MHPPAPLSTPVSWLRRAAGLLLALACAGALAQQEQQQQQQADPPARVARFDLAEGGVSFQTAADGQNRPADTRWPLTGGDQVWTDPASRAELSTGGATLRLGAATTVAFSTLDDSTAQLSFTAGTLGVVLHDLQPGERFEIDTPNLALVLNQPGRWRIDVDPAQGLTRVAVDQGSSTVYGSNGESQAMNGPLRRDFTGQSLVSPPPLAMARGDAFDRWTDERERLAASSASARYVAADVPGVAQLDNYGDWGNDPQYGAVWYPRAVAEDWAPYRDGHWEWIDPWGWTWIDAAPWGFAPFHYGRWTQTGNRWGWVPAPPRQRAAYSPALVGFVGNGGNTLNLGNGRAGVGWFPLGPGEAWRPPYTASQGYLARLNRGGFREPGNGYRFQARPTAVTVVGANDFGRRSVREAQVRQGALPQGALAQGALAQGQVVPPPQGRGFGSFGNRGGTRFGSNPGTGSPGLAPNAAPNATFNQRVQQDQFQRNQEVQQAQQRAEQERQQQQRAQQERFSPGFQQRQQEDTRRQQFMQQQQNQQQQQAQQNQINQQRQLQEQQQRQAQDQQRQMQEQQRQAQEQQRRQGEDQQRRAQEQQRAQQDQQQRQQWEQQRQAQRQQQEQQRAAAQAAQPQGRPEGRGNGDNRGEGRNRFRQQQ